MARQERWYYKNDPKYSPEEVEKIDKILKKEDTVTAVFVPLIAVSFMLCIPCFIIDLVFHIKALETAFYILLVAFVFIVLLWVFFYMKVSQERIKLMQEIEKDKVKKAH